MSRPVPSAMVNHRPRETMAGSMRNFFSSGEGRRPAATTPRGGHRQRDRQPAGPCPIIQAHHRGGGHSEVTSTG